MGGAFSPNALPLLKDAVAGNGADRVAFRGKTITPQIITGRDSSNVAAHLVLDPAASASVIVVPQLTRVGDNFVFAVARDAALPGFCLGVSKLGQVMLGPDYTNGTTFSGVLTVSDGFDSSYQSLLVRQGSGKPYLTSVQAVFRAFIATIEQDIAKLLSDGTLELYSGIKLGPTSAGTGRPYISSNGASMYVSLAAAGSLLVGNLGGGASSMTDFGTGYKIRLPLAPAGTLTTAGHFTFDNSTGVKRICWHDGTAIQHAADKTSTDATASSLSSHTGTTTGAHGTGTAALLASTTTVRAAGSADNIKLPTEAAVRAAVDAVIGSAVDSTARAAAATAQSTADTAQTNALAGIAAINDLNTRLAAYTSKAAIWSAPQVSVPGPSLIIAVAAGNILTSGWLSVPTGVRITGADLDFVLDINSAGGASGIPAAARRLKSRIVVPKRDGSGYSYGSHNNNNILDEVTAAAVSYTPGTDLTTVTLRLTDIYDDYANPVSEYTLQVMFYGNQIGFNVASAANQQFADSLVIGAQFSGSVDVIKL